ncbi:MAG: 3-deoxy-D-manno-octulosonic acid transferase [Acidobacteriota bacterium]|nr:3-deoxy-D-manno-octulosonic acid transferase [Acidobacteriota bacterium]
MRRMFVLYEVLLYLVFLIALPLFLITGLLRGKYLANFPERIGFYRTPAAAHDLWIHAVSVGETLASRPVVDEVLRRRPGTSIVFTTTTLTGQAQARRLFPEATVTYFPIDFSASVRRFLDHHQPRLFAAMETEIWPNVTRLSRARGLKLILANGRLSDRSFPRYRAIRPLLRRILRHYDRVLVRDEGDRKRFIAIGAPPEAVETTGNVKFDFAMNDEPLEIRPQIESLIAGRRVLILGSTREGEEELILPLLGDFIQKNNAFVIIAPRKPERFDVVASMLKVPFVRRTAIGERQTANALLIDSVGELTRIYPFATVAFVGGSLVPTGGHNPIEPAAAGVPVCFGPHMTNFHEIASTFLENDAAVEVRTPAELIAFATRMFDDPTARAAYGDRARKTVEQNRGAAARTAECIVELLA